MNVSSSHIHTAGVAVGGAYLQWSLKDKRVYSGRQYITGLSKHFIQTTQGLL